MSKLAIESVSRIFPGLRRSVPTKALEPIVARRAGSLSPRQISAADFDVAFITPVQAGQRPISPGACE